MTALLNLY